MVFRALACLAGVSLLSLLVGSASAEEQPTRKPRHLGSHAGGIASVHFSPDGKSVASGGGDKMIRVKDVASGRLLHEWTGPSSFTCAVRFSPDGKTVAAGGYETGGGNPIYLYDVTTGKEKGKLNGHESGGVRRLAFTSDGGRLVSAGFDGHVRIWDLATTKEIRAIKVEGGTVYDLSLSPDGRIIATAGREGLKLWEIDSGKDISRAPMSQQGCVAVVFSPDGKMVASGDNGTVTLWETATSKAIRTFNTFKGEVSQLVFSSDSRALFSASYDRHVRMWETLTGRMVFEAEHHTGWVWGVALSTDDKQLASCSVDTHLLCWDLAGVTRPTRQGARLSEKQLETHWADLAGLDASAAYRAVSALAADPETSLPLLQKRLVETRVGGPGLSELKRMVCELDADEYSVRQKASEDLARVGTRALPLLKVALENPPSPEVRRRARRLVAMMDPTAVPPEELIALRGVQTLEYIATGEARRLLEQLARLDSYPLLGQEANRALGRLNRMRVTER